MSKKAKTNVAIIEPTPSRAVHILKAHLEESLAAIGTPVTIPLHIVQEGYARARGRKSFQAFVASNPQRGPKAATPATEKAPAQFSVKVGDLFINLNDETDSGPNGEERVTPAGSLWRISDHNHGDTWDLVCDATGGWICPTEAELQRDFTRKEETPTAEASGPKCKKCGTSLDEHGYCDDVTCPFSDWPQQVLLNDLQDHDAAWIKRKYGVTKRQQPVEEACPRYWVDRAAELLEAGDKDNAVEEFKFELEAAIERTCVFDDYIRQSGRDDWGVEEKGAFVQLSYGKELSYAFTVELVVELRENELSVYVRTWHMPNGQGGNFDIYRSSSDFDETVQVADEEDALNELLKAAHQEAKAQIEMLRNEVSF